MKFKKWKSLENKYKELKTLRKSKVWNKPEINIGWYDLIDSLMTELRDKKLLNKEFRLEQVKEKFGQLRFYTSGFSNSEGYDIIIKYEDLSSVTCEDCGKPSKLREYNGWIYNKCATCFNKYLEERYKKDDELVGKILSRRTKKPKTN